MHPQKKSLLHYIIGSAQTSVIFAWANQMLLVASLNHFIPGETAYGWVMMNDGGNLSSSESQLIMSS